MEKVGSCFYFPSVSVDDDDDDGDDDFIWGGGDGCRCYVGKKPEAEVSI